jgi:hypothetical protein
MKVAEFFKKWSFVILLSFVGIAMLFTLACAIYTVITNAFVGSVGIVGAVAALCLISWQIYKEVKVWK